MDNQRIVIAAARSDRRRKSLMLALSAVLAYGAMSPVSAQSITDRFKSLFGSSPDTGSAPAPMPNGEQTDLTCPSVSIRPGASTYTVGLPGKTAVGADVRYQATIARTARSCNLNGGQITARVGIQGRVIAGPAGAPSSVDVPMRVAVVQEAVTPKVIMTKAYQTNVAMDPDGSVPFSMVIEDIVYPAPFGAAGDQYVFYIGFDPQAAKPEPKPRAAPKKKKQ